MDRESARQQWLAWAAGQTGDEKARQRMVTAALTAMEAGAGPDAAAAAALNALNPPPSPPAPASRLPGWVPAARSDRIMIGIGVGALLLVGMAAAVSALGVGSSPAPVSARATPAEKVDPRTLAVRGFIPEAKRFVEAHRGLKFSQDVPVKFLTDAAFTTRITSKPVDKKAVDIANKEFRALGLIPAGVDLGKEFTTLSANGIIGFYDYNSKELVVRGIDPNTEERVTLVHELTHALQDQHFRLSRLNTVQTDESSLAFRSLVEGDAVRIQNEYIASLPKAERDAYTAAQAKPPTGLDKVPVALLQEFGFPYIAGPTFVDALVKAHGQVALDDAFVKPPTTSAQLIHPQRFLDAQGALHVDRPGADAKPFDGGTLGELGVRVVLYQALTDHIISESDFGAATQGWAGDSYVAWDGAGRTCVRTSVATQSLDDAVALWVVSRKVAAAHKGWTVGARIGALVVVTACG